MKKIIGIGLSALTLLSSSFTFASQLCREPGWFGDIGLEGYYYHYREVDDNDSFLMHFKGSMYGLTFGFGYQPECMDLRFALEGRYDWNGRVDYASNRTGTFENSHQRVCELRLLGLYPWHLNEEWTLEGYSGLAGRALVNNDHFRLSTTNHVGWYRTSSYSYIPIGVRLINDICDMQVVGHLEYDWFLSGTQTSYITRTITNKQNDGYGLRAGVDFYIPSSSCSFDYVIGAFLRYWSIEKSDIATTARGIAWEPKNTTTELGLRVGLSF